jgi:hypothetical protein
VKSANCRKSGAHIAAEKGAAALLGFVLDEAPALLNKQQGNG